MASWPEASATPQLICGQAEDSGKASSQIPPDARGPKWRDWMWQQLSAQADAWRKEHPNAPLSEKPITTPRDNYGWRSS